MDHQSTGGSEGYAREAGLPIGAPLLGGVGRQNLQAQAADLTLRAPYLPGYGVRIPVRRFVRSGSSVIMVHFCDLPASYGTGVFFNDPNMGDQVHDAGAGHFQDAGGHGRLRGGQSVVVVDDVVGANLIGYDLLEAINNPTSVVVVDDVVGASLIGYDLLETINNPTQ